MLSGAVKVPCIVNSILVFKLKFMVISNLFSLFAVIFSFTYLYIEYKLVLVTGQ